MKKIYLIIAFMLGHISVKAAEYHVSVKGNDRSPGTKTRPFRTISHAAAVAHPGDVITVHTGTYREMVAPVHSGLDSVRRITFRAAPGEQVNIKGSDVMKNWQPVGHDVWKAVLPENFDAFSTHLFGDWFFPWDIVKQQITYVFYGNEKQFRKGVRALHTGNIFLNGQAMFEADSLEQVLRGQQAKLTFGLHETGADEQLIWFTRTENGRSVLYARFNGLDPTKELVEISIRPSCFYPAKTGVNYITVRGFDLSQCASQWAAPTAEQIGAIGTNWSKGWLIEKNTVHDSQCTGITLGKDRASGQNPWSADPSKDGSLYYNEMVLRVIRNGWNKNTIGSHIVRNNKVYRCGEAGICGSFGGAYSTIEGNDVHDIYTRRGFYGAEMGGIKLHGAIDVLIRNNRVSNTYIGIWLDWMAQGARITDNLLYNNDYVDFFPEVNHGPYLADDNLFLSPFSVKDWSEGGAYVSNIIAGMISRAPQARVTPVFKPHSTMWLDTVEIRGGDNRFFGNIFLTNNGNPFVKPADTYLPADGIDSLHSFDLGLYQTAYYPVKVVGNMIIKSTVSITKVSGGYEIKFGNALPGNDLTVTTEMFGVTKISRQHFLPPGSLPLQKRRKITGKNTLTWSERKYNNP